MLFCSNFNGTWDQYIDAFADGIPGGLDLLWYFEHEISALDPDHAVQELHPRRTRSTPIYYYNATPGSAQRDIKARAACQARRSSRWPRSMPLSSPD